MLRKNGALPISPLPFSPASRNGPLLHGAAGPNSAHTENVRTTNKISIEFCVLKKGERERAEREREGDQGTPFPTHAGNHGPVRLCSAFFPLLCLSISAEQITQILNGLKVTISFLTIPVGQEFWKGLTRQF